MIKSFSHNNSQRYLLLISLVLVMNISFAEIYKWVDDKGEVHFTDHPPENQNTEKVTVKINTYTNVSVSKNIFSSNENKKIIMYSTTWCGVCKRAKKYFQKNNITFTEYDVEKSNKGKRDYKKMNGKGVPIFLIGSKRLNGFDATKFNQIYGSSP